MSELSTLEDISLYVASVGGAFVLSTLGAYTIGAGIAVVKAGYDKTRGDIRPFGELYRDHFRKDMGRETSNQLPHS